ncbi:unnamed protein product [Closterium sp. NIES-54]
MPCHAIPHALPCHFPCPAMSFPMPCHVIPPCHHSLCPAMPFPHIIPQSLPCHFLISFLMPFPHVIPQSLPCHFLISFPMPCCPCHSPCPVAHVIPHALLPMSFPMPCCPCHSPCPVAHVIPHALLPMSFPMPFLAPFPHFLAPFPRAISSRHFVTPFQPFPHTIPYESACPDLLRAGPARSFSVHPLCHTTIPDGAQRFSSFTVLHRDATRVTAENERAVALDPP